MKKYLTLDRVIMVLIIIFLLSLNTCNTKKYMDSIFLKEQQIDSIKNKYGQTILTQEVIITSNKEDIAKLTDSIFDLKRKHNRRISELIAFYENTTRVEVKNVNVPYLDKPGMKRFQDSLERVCKDVIKYYRDSTLSVPARVKDSSTHFVFEGVVNLDSFNIKTIQFPDSQYVRIVAKKDGLFRSNKYEIQMFHTNPHVVNSGMKSYMYKPQKKNTTWMAALIFLGGTILGTQLK